MGDNTDLLSNRIIAKTVSVNIAFSLKNVFKRLFDKLSDDIHWYPLIACELVITDN